MSKYSVYDAGVDPFSCGYYIHAHQKNIGRSLSSYRNNDQGISSSDLTIKFKELKQNAKKAVENQYNALISYHFLKDIADENTLMFLSQTLKDNGNLDKINKAMKEELQERLNTDNIKNIIKQQQNIPWDEAIKVVDKIVNNLTEVTESDLRNLDQMFTAIAKGVQEVNLHGKTLAAILIHLKNTHQANLQSFGQELLTKLTEFEATLYKKDKEGEFKSVQAQQIYPVLKKLRMLANRFSEMKKNKSDEPLTGEYIKGIIEKGIFSTALGESVGAGIIYSGEGNAVLSIKNSINSIKGSVGQDTVKLDYTDTEGHYSGVSEVARQGKSDLRFENVFFDIGYVLGLDVGEIKIGFGISNKTYKTIGLTESGDLPSGYIKGGSINFQTLLNMLTTSMDLQYLVYNTFAWTSQSAPKSGTSMINKKDLEQPLIAIQDALFTRAVIYLFGSRGKQDFANFIMVNGKLVSLWELIKEVCDERKVQLSATMDRQENNPLKFKVLSHSKFGKFLGIRKKISMYQRVYNTNSLIEQARVEGHLDITKLNPQGLGS